MSFIQDVKNILWFMPVYSKTDVDEAVKGWQQEFTKVLDKHCPVKSIEVRKNYTPWLSQELLVASKVLQREQVKARTDHSRELHVSIQQKTKQLKEKLKVAEDIWRSKESNKMSETGEKTWENVKKWIGWRSISQPIMLKDPFQNNCVTVGAANLCRIMNNFYLEKVRSIKADMPSVEGDPCADLKKMLEGNKSCMTFEPVSLDLVLKISKKMKKTKSMSEDDIPADLFLLALPYMLPAITHIYNLSLMQAKFPSMWKISKICPLFKGGELVSRE